jgi:hypothetical protein
VELCVTIQAIYKRSKSGGALHIVLDDGNTEDEHIEWCMINAIPELDEEEQKLYFTCAGLLLSLNERDRLDAIANTFAFTRKWGID